MAESEELKKFLMKMKEESEKVGLKLSIQKTKIMASGPITSWQIDGETLETVTHFIWGGLQNHCRWWLQLSSEWEKIIANEATDKRLISKTYKQLNIRKTNN